MNHPLKALIQMGVVPTVTFPTDSRYYGYSTLTYTDAQGQNVTYLARRFVPSPGAPNYATVGHAYRQARRPARSDSGKISRRSADVLAYLRCQWSDQAQRPGGHGGTGFEYHHAAGRARSAECLRAFR